MIRDKQLHRFAGGYARALARRALEPRARGVRHLLFAFCDHYEPLWGDASTEVGRARVDNWGRHYPALADGYRDADGNPPRHSFFFPGEQYDPYFLSELARLAEQGYGEVEFHLHHDGDTAARLRRDINEYLSAYAEHGHLSRGADGSLKYGFIHGNWCLANAREDGRWCGVDEEIPLLFDTGCYADFTFPSAPDPCQPNIVNQIYWPTGDLTRARAYEQGQRARVGEMFEDRLLIVEGPLALTLRDGGLKPRLESSAIAAHDPATPKRVRSWVDQNITVAGRPEWVFVKVHTHGAPEVQSAALLDGAGRMLHDELARHYNDGESWKLHYVTAREMFNIAIACMRGEQGDPNDYRDYMLAPPPVAS